MPASSRSTSGPRRRRRARWRPPAADGAARDPGASVVLSTVLPLLQLRSGRAGYGTFQALFDVSLDVRRGEAVAVIGPNGAGKTTLMRVISGLIRPTAGSI